MTDGILASLALAGALFLSAPALAQTPVAIAVQGSGELPGFRVEEASSYLATQMGTAGIAAWRFVPRDPAAAAPSRIEWTFEVLPYAGGQVRQFFPMSGVQRMLGTHRLISAQAKLYLGGQYQTVIFGQETVQGGASDPELGAFLIKLTQSLEAGYRATEVTPAAHNGVAP
ncbi:MAG TPA: hypothetical protein VK515_02970 [Rhizomicrobium sp.]|nr:hypothetical protein [Rhizomicrobium sp.]